MGKIKIKTLGLEDTEKQDKEAAKRKREQKQLRKAAGEEPKEEKTIEVAAPVEAKPESVASKAEETETVEKKKKKVASKKKVRGKMYLDHKKKIDATKRYNLVDALKMIQALSKRGFDESIELHLTVLDTGLKGDVSLPHGTGKELRVVVADDVLIANLDKGVVDFDILITTPAFMPKLVKYAKLLGPKGLMPNPKKGTVTEDTDKAKANFSKGLLYFKTEAKFPLMHLSIGKKSFTESQLVENITSFAGAVGKQKIRAMFLSLTMSPSVQVNVESL